METVSKGDSKPIPWLWDSHRTPNSKWLQKNLKDTDSKVEQMIKITKENADTFPRSAKMYYEKRPELGKLIVELYRDYRALAERYAHASGIIGNVHCRLGDVFPSQIPQFSDDKSPSVSNSTTPFNPHPIREWVDPDESQIGASGESSSHSYATERNEGFTDEQIGIIITEAEIVALKDSLTERESNTDLQEKVQKFKEEKINLSSAALSVVDNSVNKFEEMQCIFSEIHDQDLCSSLEKSVLVVFLTENLYGEVSELQSAYRNLQEENHKNMIEKILLTNSFLCLEEDNHRLENETYLMLSDTLYQSCLSLIFKGIIMDKFMEVKMLNEELERLHSITDKQDNKLGEMEGKVKELQTELFSVRSYDDQLTREIATEKELLRHELHKERIEVKSLELQAEMKDEEIDDRQHEEDIRHQNQIREIYEDKSEVITKDIMLDQISDYSISRRIFHTPDFLETSGRNSCFDHEIEDQDRSISEELYGSSQQLNCENVLKSLDADLQTLGNLQDTTKELKNKVETNRKLQNVINSVEPGTIKAQLEKAEDAILNLLDVNQKLVTKVGKAFSDSNEDERRRRRRISVQANRASEKIGRLQMDIGRMQNVVMKLDSDGISESRRRVALRDYFYGVSGIMNKVKKEKKKHLLTVC